MLGFRASQEVSGQKLGTNMANVLPWNP
jgi:hypothetical protein